MIRRLAFAGSRLAVAAVFLLTWGYGVTTYSPFAFDMFVKPQLLPWLADFVVWHHVWYWAAYLLSVATLVPDLASSRRGPPRARAAWWAAAAYVVAFGVVGVYLLNTPYLATLRSGAPSLVVVAGALLPLLWLAVIDHLASRLPSPTEGTDRVIAQHVLLTACLRAGAFLWLVHLVRAWLFSAGPTGAIPWAVMGVWALALDLAVFLFVYLVFSLSSALAATRRRASAWEYGLAVILVAIAIAEFFRRIVFPPLSFSAGDAAAISAGLGTVLALMWSGLRLRSTSGRVDRIDSSFGLLWSLPDRSPTRTLVFLGAVAVATSVALDLVAQIDWASILHRVIAVVEATLVFGLFLNVSGRRREAPWSMAALLGAPLLTLVALHAMPHAAARLMAATGDGRLDPQMVIDQLPSSDVLASLAAGRLIEQQRPDTGFYRALLDTESRQSAMKPVAPDAVFAPSYVPARAPQPHVFVFVLDSLRRDYLSPYNPAVTFTPAIDGWARESLVFRNAFTPYGGTWLAMPSIWTGSAVPRGWGGIFERLNAIEPLIVAADYDFVINDFTVTSVLRATTKRTFLDPSVPSVNTDLCQNLESLRSHLDARAATARPVFAYLAPMNVHILNTRTGSTTPNDRYPGFYAPYASRLARMDECFGGFVAYLKDQGLYDNSIIMLTSDHGDSLGSDGHWGHQFYLFPEDIRVPLIVHLPSSRQSALTADLGRVTFLTDLAPTLLALLGQHVGDLGPQFGSPLFVPPDAEPKPRRRDAFLVMSSYGSTYGMLRRNGRLLYIADLMNWREYAYTLFRNPLGQPAPVSDALRRVNQALIREHVDQVATMYGIK